MISRSFNNVGSSLRDCHHMLQKAALSNLPDTTKGTKKNEKRTPFQQVATELFKCLKALKDLKELEGNHPTAQKQLNDPNRNLHPLSPKKTDTTTFSSKEEYFKALKTIKEVERLLKK